MTDPHHGERTGARGGPAPEPPVGARAPAPGTRAAAFFDVDNTLLRGVSSFYLAREMHEAGFFDRRDLAAISREALRYALRGERNSRLAGIQERALGMVAGHTRAELEAVCESAYDHALAHRIFAGARALLDSHLAAGDEVWLVTASPIEVASLLAKRLGTTGALGTIAEVEGDRYTGRLDGSLMHGETKARAIRELAARRDLDLSASSAYGDSANDQPMMRAVGHPVAVNPDGRLRRIAQREGWPVRRFTHETRSSTALRIAGVAALAAASLALHRATRRPGRAG